MIARSKEKSPREWGPYLSYGSDSSNEMRISWESDQYLHHRKLEYGETEDLGKIVEEKWCEPTRHHCIVLKGLKPDTKYYYKIDSGNYKRDKEIYWFKTGLILTNNSSNNLAFEFTVVGDIHAGSNGNIRSGFISMEKNAPNVAFNIVVGDSINNGNAEEDWQDFFKTLDPWLHNKPMMNTTGNHDTNNEGKYSRFIQTWDHPYVDKKIGAFYSFRYSNAAFIMIDSNNAGRLEGIPSDEQYDWLESELERYKKENLWIFVFLHHQIYSTGDFSMPHIMNEVYRPLFDEYRVDAVFYGHDHHYEAYWTGKDTDWGGTKYFVAGGGGGQERIDYGIMGDRNGGTKYIWQKRTYSYERDGILPVAPTAHDGIKGFRNDEIVKTSQLFGVLEPNFVHMKINGDKCILRCIGWQNQVFHELNFQKTKKQKQEFII